MKKTLFVLFVLIFMVACSSESNEEAEGETENNANNENTEEQEEPSIEEETLFTYDHEDSGEYDIMSIQMDVAGEAITFTGKEDIDRSKEYYRYLVDHDGEVHEGLELLAEDEDQDRRCSYLNVSPDGNYLVYDCNDDDVEFSVYDMQAEETIHQVPEMDPDEPHVMDILGISNDAIVYLETDNEDSELELDLYDTEDESMDRYVVKDLLELDEDEYIDEFSELIPTDDGKEILMNIGTNLYVFDTEEEDVEEIEDVEPYAEEHDTDVFIYSAEFSPDGKYAYYHLSENDSDPKYGEHVFRDLESDESNVYAEFDYRTVRGFDDDGNALLEDSEEEDVFLYNVEEDTTRIVPDMDVGVYTDYLTLSHDGSHIVYTDKDSNDDDTHTQNLKRVELGDITNYEETELRAEEEEVVEEPGQDEIALTEDSFDEAEMLTDLWESSTSVMYPTEFPSDVLKTTNHHSGDSDDRRYSQTTYLESDSHSDDEIEVTAQPKEDDRCVGFDDLEMAETIDGDDYYFYDFDNKDVEAAVSIDDYCYKFEAEEHSEDEMLDIAQSLESVDDVPHELDVDDRKFPEKFPIEDPEMTSPTVISNKDGDKIDYLMDYRGEEDTDIKMEYEVRENEPRGYGASSENVDIDGYEEALYSEDNAKMYLDDGTYYYAIKLDIDSDMLKSYGNDHVEDVFIEIAESIQ